MAELDEAVRRYYERGREVDRLAGGLRTGPLELARTTRLLERFLPPAPIDVLDVGGGPGAYAAWLADRGYRVHVVDPIPLHIDQATAAHPRVTGEVGDARELRQEDASVGAVLLLGPLYHLPDRGERQRALREVCRVLKPGGVLFAAGISRFASALDGLLSNRLADPEFAAIVTSDLTDGQHRNRTSRLDYFTTAYFHRPEELEREVQAAGLQLEGLFGLEGPGWLLGDFAARWQDAERREQLLAILRRLEREPSL
ncbi:MAG TPA: class I SAM-dependent methyltransferase, partial [Acidimicrobiia bacterium]|nr:class I SAM-dependent methyltransferase [Acidimicrobiia bacterium]